MRTNQETIASVKKSPCYAADRATAEKRLSNKQNCFVICDNPNPATAQKEPFIQLTRRDDDPPKNYSTTIEVNNGKLSYPGNAFRIGAPFENVEKLIEHMKSKGLDVAHESVAQQAIAKGQGFAERMANITKHLQTSTKKINSIYEKSTAIFKELGEGTANPARLLEMKRELQHLKDELAKFPKHDTTAKQEFIENAEKVCEQQLNRPPQAKL